MVAKYMRKREHKLSARDMLVLSINLLYIIHTELHASLRPNYSYNVVIMRSSLAELLVD